MSFNEKLPAWKNPGVEPPESLKKEGWKPGQKPPADYFDWLHYRTYKSLEELQEKAETKEGSQRKASQAERNAKNYTDEQVSEIVVPVKSVNGKTGEVELDKNDVGLGKVIDDRQATKTEFDAHVQDNVRHITASERSNWNAKETPAGAQAKADAAEQAAIDWVRERGIGSPGQTIDDLNNATEPGRWYVAGSSTANTPDGLSWWTVLVAYRNSSNLAQIAFRSIGGATQTKIRFLSGGTWTQWENIWTSFNLPNPARTDVDNQFSASQTVKNGLNYEYIGVRRDVSGTEYGAEIAVSQNGYAQLTKRDGGNIVESINIRGAGDARVGSNPIWTNGNQG